MNQQQKAEYERDMRDFRAEFIENLARELHFKTTFVRSGRSPRPYEQIVLDQIKRTLDEHLPGALEVQYPTIEDQSRR